MADIITAAYSVLAKSRKIKMVRVRSTARKKAQRVHNEHFDIVSLGGRKSCPECYAKLNGGPIISWFEYVGVNRRRVQYLCRECWPTALVRLQKHAGMCGCSFALQWHGAYDYKPEWLTLDTLQCEVSKSGIV